MQLLGTDPVTPPAKALQKNINPRALIYYIGVQIPALRSYFSQAAGSPNASQIKMFSTWVPQFVNDLIWALESLDTILGPENYRGAFSADAANIDNMMDLLYEDMAKATQSPNTAISNPANAAFSQWNSAKGNRPAGSAVVTVNEAAAISGTGPASFSANRDFKKTSILSKADIAARTTILRKISPGVKPADMTYQYSTGGGGVKSTGIINPMETGADVPTAPKKPINPLVIAGVAVAGYFAYKSLA